MTKQIKLSYETKRKRWRYCYTEGRIKKDFYSTLQNEAKARKEILAKIEAFKMGKVTEKAVTLKRACTEFLADYQNRVKVTSHRKAAQIIKAHLTPLYRFKLKDITRQDWQKIVDKAYANGASSKATLKGISTMIRLVCKYSASCGYMADGDVPLYFRFHQNATIGKKRALTPSELETLFSATDSKYIHLFRFLVLTGLRRGELCALQTERDFDGISVTIRESISHDKLITDGKTEQANRRVLLGSGALKELEAHRSINNTPSVYLFSNEDGTQISPRVLSRKWLEWREKHNIDITLHELRHTHISYAVNKTDIELDILKKSFGHADKMDTRAVYVHPIEMSEEEKLAELARLKKMMDEIESTLTS